MSSGIQELVLRDCASRPLCYRVNYFAGESGGGFMRELGEVFADKTDGHYVLIVKRSSTATGPPDELDIFAVVHTLEEADGKLYAKAKGLAEELRKKYQLALFEDRTKHYQKGPDEGT